MAGIISNLKVRFGVDSSDFKKGLKDGESALKSFKSGAGTILEEFASLFGINMRGVNDAIDTAGKSLGFFGTSLKAASGSAKGFAIAMNVVKTALISTGIGALIVALGSLIAYFKSSGEGADRLAVIMAKLRSVVDNIVDRFRIFGGGLADIFSGKFVSGWQQLKDAFSGIGAEIKEDWKLAGDLAKAEDALYDKETALILSLEQRKQKVAELREESRNLELTEQERLKKVQEAEAIIRTIYADQADLERERLRIMKEKLAIQNSDPTDEQNREIIQQEATINSLLAQQANEIRTLSRERNTLTKEVDKQLALEKERAENVKNALQEISFDNLSIPDIGGVIAQSLAPIPAALREVKESWNELSGAIESSLEEMAIGIGEFFGNLIIGQENMHNFAAMIGASFADMATTIGKVIIKAAIAVGFVDKMLKDPSKWYLALAAGVALVAIGAAVKGALASAGSSGGGASSASSGPQNFVYDMTNVKAQTVKVEVTGQLEVEAGKMKWALQQEDNRRNRVT